MSKYTGVCCTCQTGGIGLYPCPPSLLSESDQEELDGDFNPAHPFRWLCESHEFYGQHCEGSGQTPQFVTTPEQK